MDDAKYTALAYDENGCIESQSEYDDPNEAIAFAKSHDWDAVVEESTFKTIWPR